MTKSGFQLERGTTKGNEHIEIEQLKKITNYELQQFEKNSLKKEKIIQTNDIELLQKENKRIIRKYNTLSNQYVKIRNNVYMIQKINKKIQNEKNNLQFEIEKLKEENKKLKTENIKLHQYINKALECVSLLFSFPKMTLKRLIDNFNKEFNERN
ncbi:MAG: hypothetical protein J6A36_02345 [Clostridia bacterium]|nr:hypothetical protein [Clostridia bacterium]